MKLSEAGSKKHAPMSEASTGGSPPEMVVALPIFYCLLGMAGVAVLGAILWEARRDFELLAYFVSDDSLGWRAWLESGWREVFGISSLLLTILLHALAAVAIGCVFAWKRRAEVGGRVAHHSKEDFFRAIARYVRTFGWGFLLLPLPLLYVMGFRAPNFTAHPPFDDYQAIWMLATSGVMGLIAAFLAREWNARADDISAGMPAQIPATLSSRKKRFSTWTLAAIFTATLYLITFTSMTLMRHWAYNTAVHDLGFNAQAIWSLGHGYGWRVTSWGDYLGGGIYNQLAAFDYSFLGEHDMPILYLFAPLTHLFPAAEILVVAQSVAIAGAGVMLFCFARHHLGSRALGAALAISFLLHPSIHEANLKDFHADALEPLFLFSALWLWSNKSLVGYTAALAGMLACKEDAGLALAALGIFFLLGRQWYYGGIAILMGLGWFYIANDLIISPVRGGAPVRHLYRYAHLAFPALGDATLQAGFSPSGVGDLARGFFTNPWAAVNPQIRMQEFGAFYPPILTHERVRAILLIGVPVGFVFLRSWRAPILLAIPVAAALLSNWDHNYRFRMHYGVPSIQWAYVAAVMGLAAACMGRVSKANEEEGQNEEIGEEIDRSASAGTQTTNSEWAPRPSRRFAAAWSAFILVAAIHSAYHYGRAPGMKYFDPPTYLRDAAAPQADRLLRLIPEGEPAAADNTLGPHLVNRPDLMLFPQIELSTRLGDPIRAEWIIVDVSAHPWPLDRDTRFRVVASVLEADEYGVWADDGDTHGYYDGVILMKRGYSTALNAATLAKIPR